DVWRHAALLRLAAAPFAQRVEQRMVVGLRLVDAGEAPLRFLARGLCDRLPEAHRGFAAQERARVGGQAQDRILIAGLLEESLSDQLPDPVADLVARRSFQNAVRAERVVAPLADL